MLVRVLRDDARRGAGAVGAQPRVQPVLAPPARRTTTRARTARASASTRCARWAGRCRRAGRRTACSHGWAFPFVAVKERSFGKAKLAFDYLYTDQTRLLPAVALEEAFASVIDAHAWRAPESGGALARMLAEDLAAHRLRAHSAVSVEPRLRRCARGVERRIRVARARRSGARANRAGAAAAVSRSPCAIPTFSSPGGGRRTTRRWCGACCRSWAFRCCCGARGSGAIGGARISSYARAADRAARARGTNESKARRR